MYTPHQIIQQQNKVFSREFLCLFLMCTFCWYWTSDSFQRLRPKSKEVRASVSSFMVSSASPLGVVEFSQICSSVVEKMRGSLGTNELSFSDEGLWNNVSC